MNMNITVKLELTMTNKHELALQQSRALSTGVDPFAAYGAKHRSTGGANFLSFHRSGEWLYGQNDTVLPLGTKLAANMTGMRVGWRKWHARQVVDDRTMLLIEQVPLEARAALGDLDEQLWELSPEGKSRDPWVLTNILELADTRTGASYLYTTSSRGGQGCIANLCETYSKLGRQQPAGYTPVVEIDNDSYTHQAYGKTYVPVLTIVGWLDENGKPAGDEGGVAPMPQAEAIPDKKVPRF
jgi:hypothetical protein